MLVKQELINKIKDYFDLNVYETKVWLALLGKGIASAGEIADISGVPRSRTYDVLESLEKRGFAIIKLGKPVKYLGVKPKIIIEKLKNNVKKDADDRIEDLSKIKTTDEFLKLEGLYKDGISPLKREEITASIKGKSNISNQLKEILQNASKEIIICTNAEEMNQKIKLFSQTFENLKKADIKIKIALSGDSQLIKKIAEKLGVKIKEINLEAKFFIIDRKEVLFYLYKTSSEEDVAIWLNSEFFSEAFASLFDKAIGGK
jgi:sugar-specific transcriptional regulator TrmB